VRIASFALAALLVACSSAATAIAPGARPARNGWLPAAVRPHGCSSGSSSNCIPIQHVVVIVEENRSFDNVFAGYPGADAPMTGKLHSGRVVALTPINFDTVDVDHSYGASIQDYDGGKMDGFERNWTSNNRPAGRFAYSYLERKLVAPYWSLARQYTLADRMFPTEHGSSWTAHLDVIGTTNISPTKALVDFPSHAPYDCQAPAGTVTSYITASGQYKNDGPPPCFTQFATMADTLDAAGVSWRFYAPAIDHDLGGIWSPFGAIKRVRRGPDWAHVINPPSRILTDIGNGSLASVTWVTPEWGYSDHPGGAANQGPSWVASIVNAIGQSPFWNSTAIVIFWDDWGGFYDDAVPPQLDFKGLGIRVPCLIVSPYARPGYVSHTQYEFGSVQRFIEQVFNLPQLGTAAAGYSDARANSILDSFDFTQAPIVFSPISAPYPPSTFLRSGDGRRIESAFGRLKVP
jgi:phospholipase C